MISGIEAAILEIISDNALNNDKSSLLSIKDIYNLQDSESRHGVHQIRRTTNILCKKGFLFKQPKRHNLHLYRLLDKTQRQDKADFIRSTERYNNIERELPEKLSRKLEEILE